MMQLDEEGAGRWLLDQILPDDGADTIEVTQDAAPLLFGVAAYHKLREPAVFVATLRDYRIVPAAWVAVLAALVVVAEVALTASLLVPAVVPVAAAGCVGLLAVYSGAIALNLLRGRRHIDCGCLGPAHRQPLAPWLLARNAVVGVAALVLLLPGGDRALFWVDRLSVAAAVPTLSLLWIAVHQIGAFPQRST
jgi:hypothetical protein